MALDSILISALTDELNGYITDMRIDKIYQPEKDVFIFNLRKPGTSVGLLLSAGVGTARVHITNIPRENPKKPPVFCMLLRKHLTGARITEVSQPYLERIIDIRFETLDELGSVVSKRVIVEMIGKHSNLIVCDNEGRIIDCLRKVDAGMSEARQILPGMYYRLPPVQNKLDPFSVTRQQFNDLLDTESTEIKLDKWILNTFSALSPLICREIAYSIAGRTDMIISECTPDEISDAFFTFIAFVGRKACEPVMLKDGGRPFDISFIPIRQYESAMDIVKFDTYSELLDSFYTVREKHDRAMQRSRALLKRVKNLRDRTARKLALRREELKATYDRESLREQGDIIKANIHSMQKGLTVLKAQNFYSQDLGDVEIKLDPKLSPQQNAAKYYKAYNKAKNAEQILTGQIKVAESELEYFESVLEAISRAATEKELAEIRYELAGGGYIKSSRDMEKKLGKKLKSPESAPLRFVSSTGTEILVGKNNLQNDRLTLKTANKNDIWLHTQKIHGSHVIARTSSSGAIEPDQQTLYEAAALAAYYSKARGGENVPVDYTKVKRVKKPAGAKPGMVTYTEQKTVYVTPDTELINKLKK